MKFFIKTFGCQMNVNDSEKMDTILLSEGFDAAENVEDSDVVVINSCAVRDKAQQKIFSYAGRLKRSQKVIVAGCVAQSEKDELLKKGTMINYVVGTHNYYEIGKIAKELMNRAEKGVSAKFSREWKEIIPESFSRNSLLSGFISIMEGCDNFCTYCIVPFTRGREKHRPFKYIMEEAGKLAKDGFKEVILIGQNVNSWKDEKENRGFPELLDRLASEYPFRWIRFITSYPGYHDDDLIDVMKRNRNIARHIHFPAQSGSSSVLKRMGRVYSREQYLDIVTALKKEIHGIRFSSDFIVGFPRETEKEFNETISLLDEVRFDSVFSFIFSKRRYTKAAELSEDISPEVKKRRLQVLQERQRQIQLEDHEKMVGKELDILVTGPNPKKSGEVLGRSETYKVVNFRSSAKKGTFKRVKITGFGPYSLSGSESEERF